MIWGSVRFAQKCPSEGYILTLTQVKKLNWYLDFYYWRLLTTLRAIVDVNVEVKCEPWLRRPVFNIYWYTREWLRYNPQIVLTHSVFDLVSYPCKKHSDSVFSQLLHWNTCWLLNEWKHTPCQLFDVDIHLEIVFKHFQDLTVALSRQTAHTQAWNSG